MTDHDKPMSMVERVARAIDPISWMNPLEDDLAEDRSDSLRAARAAISAMRCPTEGMIRAIGTAQFEPEELWQAMIDAALEGK